jgi:hypothetical protein
MMVVSYYSIERGIAVSRQSLYRVNRIILT